MFDIIYKMIISNKYEVLEKIGEGCFGQIYKGRNIRTGENVAIKVEPIANQTKLLKNETKIYQYLAQGQGIPRVKWFGVDEKNNYMVVTLLGDSLSDVVKKKGTFSLEDVLKIGKQILERLQYVHNMGLIHRDIKPDNFLMGKDNVIFLIDFGLCKKYLKDDVHTENKKLSKLLGTPAFVSVNIHNLNQPSRRDDLESMVYTMVYLYCGSLPWFGMEDLDEIKSEKINLMKDVDIPRHFIDMLRYIRLMKFEEKPNYEYLYGLLC
jgi:serine/threonine protein kinase